MLTVVLQLLLILLLFVHIELGALIAFGSLKLMLKSLSQIIEALIQKRRICLSYSKNAKETWTGMPYLGSWIAL